MSESPRAEGRTDCLQPGLPSQVWLPAPHILNQLPTLTSLEIFPGLVFFFLFASCVGGDIFLQDLATLTTSLLGAIRVVASFTTGMWSSSTTSPAALYPPCPAVGHPRPWAIPALQRWFVS